MPKRNAWAVSAEEITEQGPPFDLPDQVFDGRSWRSVFAAPGHRVGPATFHMIPEPTLTYWHLAAMNWPPCQLTWSRRAVRRDGVAGMLRTMGYNPARATAWEPDTYLPQEQNPFAPGVTAKREPTEYLERPTAPGSFVYFTKTDGAPFVKIGWAIDPNKRRGELQTGCPYPLTVAAVVPGTLTDEAKFHRQFAALRVRPDGEWFRHEGELAAFISSLVNTEPAK